MGGARDFYCNRYGTINFDALKKREKAALKIGLLQAVQREIGPDKRKILDIGCGIGSAASYFSQQGHQVCGVDVSPELVAHARKRVPNGHFNVMGEGDILPFADGSVEVCFCSEVLEHVFDVSHFLREIKRVLVDGGKLFLIVPYHGRIKNMLVCLFNFEWHFHPLGGHIRFFNAKSLRLVLEREGFLVTKQRGYGRCWPIWTLFGVAAQKKS